MPPRMGSSDESTGQNPLLQPRVVRLLKERNRVVDFGLREEFLDELEEIIAERRRPNRVAERATDEALERARSASRNPVRSRVEERVSKMNETIFRNL